MVDDELQEQLRVLIQEPVKPGELKAFTLVKQYYQTCMNTTRVEEIGLGTINEFLRELGGWPVVVGSEWNEKDFDWKKVTYQLRHFGLGDTQFITFHISLDDNNSTKRILKVSTDVF